MAAFSSSDWANLGAQLFGGLAKATPAVVSVLSQPKQPVFDPSAYQSALQSQSLLATQSAIAQQQAQAAQMQAQAEVEVQRLRSGTASRLLIYGGIAILVAVGIMYLAKKGKDA
jgi:hypothetical protein